MAKSDPTTSGDDRYQAGVEALTDPGNAQEAVNLDSTRIQVEAVTEALRESMIDWFTKS